jgi:hypothetical protein
MSPQLCVKDILSISGRCWFLPCKLSLKSKYGGVEIAVKHNRCSVKFRKNVGGRNDNNDRTYQTRNQVQQLSSEGVHILSGSYGGFGGLKTRVRG